MDFIAPTQCVCATDGDERRRETSPVEKHFATIPSTNPKSITLEAHKIKPIHT